MRTLTHPLIGKFVLREKKGRERKGKERKGRGGKGRGGKLLWCVWSAVVGFWVVNLCHIRGWYIIKCAVMLFRGASFSGHTGECRLTYLALLFFIFKENIMYRWFINFHHADGSGFKIKDSTYDLDTSDGLLLMIQELESEYNKNIVPISWKRLNKNIGFDGNVNIGYLEIIMRGLRMGGFCSVNFANGTKETLMDSIRYKSDGVISEGDLSVIAEMIIDRKSVV